MSDVVYTIEVHARPAGNPDDPALLQEIEDRVDESLCGAPLIWSDSAPAVSSKVVKVADAPPPDGPALEPRDDPPTTDPPHDGGEEPLQEAWRPEPGQIAQLPDSPWLYASAPIPARSRGTVRAVDNQRAIVTVTALVNIDVPVDQLSQVVPG